MSALLDPCILIIFGATGDLTQKKLLPALYRLQVMKMLPESFRIVGFATRKLTDREFQEYVEEAIREFSRGQSVDPDGLKKLTRNISFVSASFEDGQGYQQLSRYLSGSEKSGKIFYLATPPNFFPIIIEGLNQAGLTRFAPRIIIEKPFGIDFASARELNKLVLKYFPEEQVFRIDHYLGKETVQNILYFRFANGIYEPIWNRSYIDHVQITVAETEGIGKRGKYFEQAGTLRDMFQNHIMQLLSLVAMEVPINTDPEMIKEKKIDLLRSLRPIEPEEVEKYAVRGQVAGYREEADVSPSSSIETFAALKVMIDNWRWSGVPFYIRSGKRMKKFVTEIAVHFKHVPHCLFTRSISGCPENNILVFKIQPDEGITFRINVKKPGTSNYIERVNMDFSYRDSFKIILPEAYERLLYDCILGDTTLFPNSQEIETAWEYLANILKGWENNPLPQIPNYPPGSWGPEESDNLIGRDGRLWINY